MSTRATIGDESDEEEEREREIAMLNFLNNPHLHQHEYDGSSSPTFTASTISPSMAPYDQYWSDDNDGDENLILAPISYSSSSDGSGRHVSSSEQQRNEKQQQQQQQPNVSFPVDDEPSAPQRRTVSFLETLKEQQQQHDDNDDDDDDDETDLYQTSGIDLLDLAERNEISLPIGLRQSVNFSKFSQELKRKSSGDVMGLLNFLRECNDEDEEHNDDDDGDIDLMSFLRGPPLQRNEAQRPEPVGNLEQKTMAPQNKESRKKSIKAVGRLFKKSPRNKAEENSKKDSSGAKQQQQQQQDDSGNEDTSSAMDIFQFIREQEAKGKKLPAPNSEKRHNMSIFKKQRKKTTITTEGPKHVDDDENRDVGEDSIVDILQFVREQERMGKTLPAQKVRKESISSKLQKERQKAIDNDDDNDTNKDGFLDILQFVQEQEAKGIRLPAPSIDKTETAKEMKENHKDMVGSDDDDGDDDDSGIDILQFVQEQSAKGEKLLGRTQNDLTQKSLRKQLYDQKRKKKKREQDDEIEEEVTKPIKQHTRRSRFPSLVISGAPNVKYRYVTGRIAKGMNNPYVQLYTRPSRSNAIVESQHSYRQNRKLRRGSSAVLLDLQVVLHFFIRTNHSPVHAPRIDPKMQTVQLSVQKKIVLVAPPKADKIPPSIYLHLDDGEDREMKKTAEMRQRFRDMRQEVWTPLLTTEPVTTNLHNTARDQDVQFGRVCICKYDFASMDQFRITFFELDTYDDDHSDASKLVEFDVSLAAILGSNMRISTPINEHISLLIVAKRLHDEYSPVSSPSLGPNSLRPSHEETMLDVSISANLNKKWSDLFITVSQETTVHGGSFVTIFTSEPVCVRKLKDSDGGIAGAVGSKIRETKWAPFSIKPQPEVLENEKKLKFEISYYHDVFDYRVPIGSFECFFETLANLHGITVPLLQNSSKPESESIGTITFNKLIVRTVVTQETKFEHSMLDFMRTGRIRFDRVFFAVDMTCKNRHYGNEIQGKKTSLHTVSAENNLYMVLLRSIAERLEQYQQGTRFHLIGYGGLTPENALRYADKHSEKKYANLQAEERLYRCLSYFNYQHIHANTSAEKQVHSRVPAMIEKSMESTNISDAVQKIENGDDKNNTIEPTRGNAYTSGVNSNNRSSCTLSDPLELSPSYHELFIHTFSDSIDCVEKLTNMYAAVSPEISLSNMSNFNKDKRHRTVDDDGSSSRFGPNDFHHIIHDVTEFIKWQERLADTNMPMPSSPINYNLLVVLIPDDAIDLKKTLVRLVEACGVPLSVFIVGIGNYSSFKLLRSINTDPKIHCTEREIQYRIKKRIPKLWNVEHCGIKASRNVCEIATFPFPQWMRRTIERELDEDQVETTKYYPGEKEDNCSNNILQWYADRLAEKLLRNIPKHVVKFMKLRGIEL